MFHATNFTESSVNVLPLETLMKTSLMLWEKLPYFRIDPKTAGPQELGQVATMLADQTFVERFGEERRPDFEGHSPEQVAAWMFNAVSVEWFGLWGDLAFPRIQMSHSFAAMLMATTISPKEIEHVEAPWPAFMIEVPEGLLPITVKGETKHIRRIHVTSSFLPGSLSTRWWAIWMVGTGVEIYRVGPLAEAAVPRPKTELAKVPLVKIDDPNRSEPRDHPVGNNDEELAEFWEGYDNAEEDRLAVLAGRLVIGACVFMTERANFTEKLVKPNVNLSAYARRLGKKPESRVYTVGKPVKLDFRLAVKSFLEGRRASLTAQSLVAGHHKRQAHGPNSSLRKWIFVEPYWRGPEDGAIVVRPHVGGDP